eukprot:GILI01036708.1.p1 GENE.GILI01036708.1~~GILI01036708.1.p1  ORF type:complete len:226 (+),score=24.06 GILI01036708.1:158-835(+)
MVFRVPDKSRIPDVLSLFPVFNSCEPDFEIFSWTSEFWGVVSSAIFLLPYMSLAFNKGFEKRPEPVQRCYRALIPVAIASALFHTFMNPVSQYLDQTAIVFAEFVYAESAGMNISRTTKILMVFLQILGYFHGLPLVAVVVYFFIRFNLVVVENIQRIPALKSLGLKIILCNIGAMLCFPLDFLLCHDEGFLYMHALWHLFIAGFCWWGGHGVELLLQYKAKQTQ